jgi:hypothetical protein
LVLRTLASRTRQSNAGAPRNTSHPGPSTRWRRTSWRHEPEIGGTTDVAAHLEFAGRKKTKLLDGVAVTGWFTDNTDIAVAQEAEAR